MIDHYNAFISYRHAPLDIKVAEHIQSKLEHFHIPGKIRKKTGMERIQRIFRDKDELPITSDLSDTISHALENSDYLIVICTHNTKESVWVKREIEFFLKNHSRDKILAVLAEGEPYEVLPEELLQEEVHIINADGTESVFLREKEPLCCDYRTSFRKADKQELPRLAAALIGCSYDELMNRRRAYQLQRITVLAMFFIVLALSFSAYMIYKQLQLKRSYQETLRNQAIYLANESENLLEQENRIEAIQLALEALPKNAQDDRPITSEAVRALTDATLAYTPLSGTSIHSVWNYKAPSSIKKMKLSPNNKVFTVVDSAMKVICWDTESHEVIFERSFAGQRQLFIDYADDERLLITCDQEIALYNMRTQANLWTHSINEYANRTDPKQREEYIKKSDPMLNNDRSWVIIPSQNAKLYRISIEDGTLLDEYSVRKDTDTTSISMLDCIAYYLSPDETKVAVICEDFYDCFEVCVFDLQEGTFQQYTTEDPHFRYLLWTDNNTIVFSGYDMLDSNILKGNATIVCPHSDHVCCIDVSTMTEKWSHEFTYNVYNYDCELLNLPTRNAVAYATGDIMEIYSVENGDVLGSYSTQQILIDIHDNDGDGVPVYVTKAGTIGVTVDSLGAGTTAYYSYFVDNVSDVVYGDGFYVLQEDSNQVILYKDHVSDEEWTEIDESVELAGVTDWYLDDDYLVIRTLQYDAPHIVAYDANATALLFEIDLEGCSYGASQLLQVYEDELFVMLHDTESNLCVRRISMANGETLEEIILGKFTFAPSFEGSMSGEFFTYLTYDPKLKTGEVHLYNVNTGDEESFVIPLDTFNPQHAPVYYPECNIIYYIDEVENYIIDVKDHKVRKVKLPTDWTGTELVKPDSKGERWIIADKSTLLIFDQFGEKKSELLTGDMSAIGAAFYKEGTSKEQILVVYDDGSFYRYDSSSGDFLGKTEVEAYYHQGFHADIYIGEEQDLLYIQSSQITDIVDTNTWVEVAVVWNSLGYHAPTDRFFAFGFKSTKDFRIGYFEHYTLTDLTNKARKIIGSAELTEEQKSRYGIS